MPNKLPREFTDKLKSIYTPAELKIVKSGFATEQRLPSFRINTLQGKEEETIASLEKDGLKIKKIDFLENAYQLEE